MEEVIKVIQEKTFIDLRNKLFFTIGYMRYNDKVNKKEALEIIEKILNREI